MLKEKISGKKSLMFEVLLFGKENNTGADINEKSYRIIKTRNPFRNPIF